MKYRLAELSDIDFLAQIHFKAGKIQVGGFMHKLGLPFLRTYYGIRLNDENSVIWVAEDESSSVCGFVSGTLDSQKTLLLLKKNRIKLGFSVLPILFKVPGMLSCLKARYDFVSLKSQSEPFGITCGPRLDYWGWDPSVKGGSSLFLMKVWLDDVFSRNVYCVYGEVDRENGAVTSYVALLGARVLNEQKLKDGRNRIFIEFKNKHFTKN